MKRFSRCAVLALAALCLSLSLGCSKKEAKLDVDAEFAAVVAKLPAATAVKAALDKKDYDAAMTALLEIKGKLTTDEQQTEFVTLSHWMKMKLMDVAADPKAAEALNALRGMGSTR